MADENRISGVFSYQLTDVIQSHFAFEKTRPFYKVHRAFTLVLVVVNIIDLISFVPLFGITLLARVISPDPAFDSLAKIGLIITLAFFLLLVISILGLYQPLTRYRIRKAYQSNTPFYEEVREFVAGDEGIQINLPDWKSSFGWSRMGLVYEYGQAFLLLFTQGDYLTLPKRVFPDPETVLEFKRLVEKNMETEIVQIN